MAALKKRYYQKIDEEVYSAILDNGMSLSIIKKKGFLEKHSIHNRVKLKMIESINKRNIELKELSK